MAKTIWQISHQTPSPSPWEDGDPPFSTMFLPQSPPETRLPSIQLFMYNLPTRQTNGLTNAWVTDHILRFRCNLEMSTLQHLRNCIYTSFSVDKENESNTMSDDIIWYKLARMAYPGCKIKLAFYTVHWI